MGFNFVSFFPRAVMQGIPLLFGSTGEILTEKSGNLNLGIPGIMYVGGISGVIGSFFYEQAVPAAEMNGFLAIMIPILCSLLGSLLMGLLYCFLTVTLRANQNVTGLAMTTTIVDGRGFTAVMVSWMAKFNPIIMIFVSLLLVVLNRGAGEISTAFGLNRSFADILTGIILFFIIGCEFFINYQVSIRKSGGKEA